MGICLSVFVNDGESMCGQINTARAAITHSYNSTFKPKLLTLRGFPGCSAVKNPPAMQEPQKTWVPSLGWENPLEVGVATHSSLLAWRIPWTEETGVLQSMGSQRVRHDRST